MKSDAEITEFANFEQRRDDVLAASIVDEHFPNGLHNGGFGHRRVQVDHLLQRDCLLFPDRQRSGRRHFYRYVVSLFEINFTYEELKKTRFYL